jgi:23S rRNA pseudouridine2605 synthase
VDGERLAKRIARAGVCSRRDAEVLIAQGVVKVNGVKITSPATNVSESDTIEVRGKALDKKEETRLWLYHKPKERITTHKDEKGRRTVFESMPEGMPRVISVGRLDYNSEGLLLLTNDGELARLLELPTTGWIRRYRVRVFGTPNADVIARLGRGITIDGVKYKGADVVVESASGSNAWLSVSLKEGKNREIRKLFEHFGHPVSRLLRVSYGPFLLGKLTPGQVKEVPMKTLKTLLPKAK